MEEDLLEGLAYHTVLHVNGAVCKLCQLFVVGNDNKGLTEMLAQVEEELVQFLLVL